MPWRIEYLHESIQDEIESWLEDMQARLFRIIELIQEFGLERIHEPYVKHLQDKLWEMRVKGRDGIARAIYVTAQGKRLVIVHAFRKKTQKAPRRVINLALLRAREIDA
ncbi:MAG: type II toxin-antitoxin system RelE/ParE family toxin [Magnetococcales bacterium]|nr:type II toxin-antitoxin system RelE/ParE family toxin [Magnetococcales bacterium]